MIFDIGANVGYWTEMNLKNADKIISIEASPNTYRRLLEKHGSNPKVECLNYAVCNRNCEDVSFFDAENHVLSSLNKEWFTSPESRFYNDQMQHEVIKGRNGRVLKTKQIIVSSPFNEIIVKSITLDKLIQNYGIPSLIKIDVENGEYDCISSLTQKVPLLCFEWASEMKHIAFQCLDHLYDLGFNSFSIQYKDDYDFIPTEYNSIDNIKENLTNTIPKVDWGMIWCK